MYFDFSKSSRESDLGGLIIEPVNVVISTKRELLELFKEVMQGVVKYSGYCSYVVPVDYVRGKTVIRMQVECLFSLDGVRFRNVDFYNADNDFIRMESFRIHSAYTACVDVLHKYILGLNLEDYKSV